MRWKSLAGVVAMAVGALVIGALFGRPGSGRADATTTQPPTNQTVPTISGIAQAAETLTADPGTWTGSPTGYTYTWIRCDDTGSSCSVIAGATASTYTLVAPDDVGSRLKVTVVATNAGGDSSPATSALTGKVASAAKPTHTAGPVISGTVQVGSTLTASKGTWSDNVDDYTYAWQRCDDNGNNCSPISAATNSSYKLTSADSGTTLRVVVTATNATGSTSATSVPTAVVPVPISTGCPTGTGTIQITDLKPPARLAIDSQSITPATVTRSASAITVHFRVTACGGRPVQGATVFAVSIPYNQFKGQSGTTGADGTVTMTESRQAAFPATRHQERLVMLLRANKPGASVVADVSTRRVVSFPVAH